MKLTPAQLYRIDVAEEAMKTANKVLISTYSDIVEDCPYKPGDRVMVRKKGEADSAQCHARIESVDVQDGAYFFAVRPYKGNVLMGIVGGYEPIRQINSTEWQPAHPREGMVFNKATGKYE